MTRGKDAYHPSASSHGQALAKIERYMANDGSLRAAAVVCSDVIEEARQIHNSFPIATAALGRSLIGVGLLASFLKDEEKLSLHFKGDGPLGQVFAEGTEQGFVRGFVSNSQVALPNVDGKLAVGQGVGRGVLSVAHSAPFEKSPYTGTVPIQTGEVAEDIAFYLYQSMQIPSIVALGVHLESDLKVSAAGGLIVQVMPGASEKVIQTLESGVKGMKSITELIRGGAGPTDLVMELLEDFTLQNLDSTKPKYLSYSCHCSKVRVLGAIQMLGKEELQTMVEEKSSTEVRCDCCGRKYEVTSQDVKELLSKQS